MNEELIKLEQYRIYTESKDRFIDRSFKTNRYYFIIILVAGLILSLSKVSQLESLLGFELFLTFVGLCTSLLWYINQDSYAYLIKIKYAKVIEEIEKELPLKPNQLEYSAAQENKKEKNVIRFTEVQKFVALALFFFFCIYFLYSLVPIVINLIKELF